MDIQGVSIHMNYRIKIMSKKYNMKNIKMEGSVNEIQGGLRYPRKVK